MSSFLAQIEHHLERVERIATTEVVDVGLRPDFGRHEANVLAKLDAEKASSPGSPRLERWAQRQLERWGRSNLEHLVDELHWELLAGFGAKLSHDRRAELIDHALTVVVTEDHSHAGDATAMRLAAIGRDRANVVMSEATGHPWQIVSRYCVHVGLATTRDALRLCLAGRVFRDLRGLDRLRWLVALENVRGAGNDEWCIGTADVARVVRDAGRSFDADDEGPRDHVSWVAIMRWSALGLVREWPRYDDVHGEIPFYGFDLTEAGKQILADGNRDSLELFRNQALAQLHDERNAVLGFERTTANESSLAASRQARLVAHELRNALLPIHEGLRPVWAALARSGADAELTEIRAQIESSVRRLYRFADAAVKTIAPLPSESTTFRLLEAIDEARRSLPDDFPGHLRIETLPPAANPICRGHRGRLVLALRNLLNNATESGTDPCRIDILVDARDTGVIHLHVDDDGPGVSETQRSAVFEPGFSTKPHGAGQGLALVREVVEQDFGGAVRCEPSPMGGARFHLSLPNVEAP